MDLEMYIPSLTQTPPSLATDFNGTLVSDLISQGTWNVPLLLTIFNKQTVTSITLIRINSSGKDIPSGAEITMGHFRQNLFITSFRGTIIQPLLLTQQPLVFLGLKYGTLKHVLGSSFSFSNVSKI